MTVETYAAMLGEQQGVCKICKKPRTDKRPLAVDHCHTTGIIRGLLCIRCNLGLGYLDNKEWVDMATVYQKGPHENKERVDQVKLTKAAKRKPAKPRKSPAKKCVSTEPIGESEGGC